VDYLLKPIDPAHFRAAIERTRAILLGRRPQEVAQRVYDLLDHIESARPRVSRFMAREGSRVRFVRIEEVEAIEATGKYMHLHCGRTSHLIRETMATLEGRLDPRRFMRTHRSWIVNLEAISEVHPQNDRTSVVVLHSGRKVPVSRHYHDRLDRLVRDPLVESK
jgi:two-component system LytT family response regulator